MGAIDLKVDGSKLVFGPGEFDWYQLDSPITAIHKFRNFAQSGWIVIAGEHAFLVREIKEPRIVPDGFNPPPLNLQEI